MAEYEIGGKVQYSLFDKKGVAHWFEGVIHGVRDYDATETAEARRTYLIDTGRDVRLDEYSRNLRDEEVGLRVTAIIEDDDDPITDVNEALEKVSEAEDLPEDKVVTESIRQPEQIELPADRIRFGNDAQTITAEAGRDLAPGRIKP